MLDRQHARGERRFVVVVVHGDAPCATIGPWSSAAVTKCTVQPWTRTPSASARRCVSSPGIRRQQRRMDVEHPAFVARDDLGSKNAHETGENDEVGLGRSERVPQRCIERVPLGISGVRNDDARERHARRRRRAPGLPADWR
jgi:hypothetical protein